MINITIWRTDWLKKLWDYKNPGRITEISKSERRKGYESFTD